MLAAEPEHYGQSIQKTDETPMNLNPWRGFPMDARKNLKYFGLPYLPSPIFTLYYDSIILDFFWPTN
jgi:hypothetical protein